MPLLGNKNVNAGNIRTTICGTDQMKYGPDKILGLKIFYCESSSCVMTRLYHVVIFAKTCFWITVLFHSIFVLVHHCIFSVLCQTICIFCLWFQILDLNLLQRQFWELNKVKKVAFSYCWLLRQHCLYMDLKVQLLYILH